MFDTRTGSVVSSPGGPMSVILENGLDPFDADAERTLIRHGAEGANTASASPAQISLRSGRGCAAALDLASGVS